MSILIEQLKKQNPTLKKAEIEGILYILKTNPNLTNKGLIQKTGIPKETLKAFKSHIGNLLTEPTSDLISLSEEGKTFLSTLDVKPYKWSLLDITNLEIGSKLIELRKKYPLSPKREYDQFFATEKTSVAKTKMLDEKGVIKNKKIALVGDDDWLCITIPLLSKDYLRIDVYEVDEELVSTLKKIIEDLNLENIYIHKCDIRNGFPGDAYFGADVVVLDPPYTKAGVSMFLNTAVKLLGSKKEAPGKYIFMYYGNSFRSPEKTIKVQEVLNNFGLVIEDKIDKFARYNGAESIGSASSLYILKPTSFTKEKKDLFGSNSMYTYQGQKEEKFPTVDHVVIKATGVPSSLFSKKSMQKVLGNFCNKHKLNVVQKNIAKFKGGGFTFSYVLSNSNLSVHTWPEFNAIHIDLVTCTLIYNKERLYETLKSLLQTDKITVKTVE